MQQYQIKYSRSLTALNLSLHLLAILAILVFAQDIWMAGLLLLLATLLMISDCLRWQKMKRQGATTLTLYPHSSEIEIQCPYRKDRFNKFTLYLNRWFVILQLRDRDVCLNFQLNSDRFESITEYLNFRHRIVKMSRGQYVA